MPMPKREPTDQEKESMGQLAKLMGHGLDDFDVGVVKRIEELQREGNYRRMHAAQSGGSLEMGPSDCISGPRCPIPE